RPPADGGAAALGAGRADAARGHHHGDAVRPVRRQPSHPGRDRPRARPDPRADQAAREAVAVQAAPPEPRAAAARLRELTTPTTCLPTMCRARPPAGPGIRLLQA